MPTPLSSWNGQLPTDVILDSGILYFGASPGTAFSAQQGGGLKWDPGKDTRQTEFDGQHAPVAGIDRTTFVKPSLKGQFLQIPVAAWSQLEPGAALATVTGGPAGATQVQPKQAGVLYAAGDYLTNARIAFMRGDGTYFQIRMPKALVIKWALSGTEKAEGVYDIELEARLDMTVSGNTPATPPYVGEYFTAAP